MIADFEDSSCQHLISAYCSTTYRVLLRQETLDVKIGQRHPRLDQLIHAERWHIITAFNPGSRQLSDADNRQRHAGLIDAVNRASLQSWPTRHIDPNNEWPVETGLLITRCAEDWIHHQAHRFGQLAIVSGVADQPAELWLYADPGPDCALPHLRVLLP